MQFTAKKRGQGRQWELWRVKDHGIRDRFWLRAAGRRCEGQRSQHAMPLCQAKTVLAETAEIRFLCCTYQNRFANVMNIS